MIVDRRELKSTLGRILALLGNRAVPQADAA
jgi:hypothetical protein